MFAGFNGYTDTDDLIFTKTKFNPMCLLCNFMNTKYEHKTVLIKQIENANTWQTGLKKLTEKVHKFFEERRLKPWKMLSIS